MKTRGFAAMCRALGRTLGLTRPLPVVGGTGVAEIALELRALRLPKISQMNQRPML